jgi:pyrrolidone-carboxylate peptidase
MDQKIQPNILLTGFEPFEQVTFPPQTAFLAEGFNTGKGNGNDEGK